MLTESRLQEGRWHTNNDSRGIKGRFHAAKLEYPLLDNDLE